MGIEFNILKESEGLVPALKQYQYRLNQHGGTLLDIMSAKEIMSAMLEIDDKLKEHTSGGGTGAGTPLDETRKFLTGTVH